jgi:translation initiation factor 1A
MPKNSKAKKNGSARGQQSTSSKPLIIADDEQDYGIALKALGDRHFTVACQDGKERRGRVRGKMKNRQFVREGDVVLISFRGFDDDDADIIDVYTADQVRALRKSGELKIGADGDGQVRHETEGKDEEEVPFDFESI